MEKRRMFVNLTSLVSRKDREGPHGKVNEIEMMLKLHIIGETGDISDQDIEDKVRIALINSSHLSFDPTISVQVVINGKSQFLSIADLRKYFESK